jgi:hypothetical protein
MYLVISVLGKRATAGLYQLCCNSVTTAYGWINETNVPALLDVFSYSVYTMNA